MSRKEATTNTQFNTNSPKAIGAKTISLSTVRMAFNYNSPSPISMPWTRTSRSCRLSQWQVRINIIFRISSMIQEFKEIIVSSICNMALGNRRIWMQLSRIRNKEFTRLLMKSRVLQTRICLIRIWLRLWTKGTLWRTLMSLRMLKCPIWITRIWSRNWRTRR